MITGFEVFSHPSERMRSYIFTDKSLRCSAEIPAYFRKQFRGLKRHSFCFFLLSYGYPERLKELTELVSGNSKPYNLNTLRSFMYIL